MQAVPSLPSIKSPAGSVVRRSVGRSNSHSGHVGYNRSLRRAVTVTGAGLNFAQLARARDAAILQKPESTPSSARDISLVPIFSGHLEDREFSRVPSPESEARPQRRLRKGKTLDPENLRFTKIHMMARKHRLDPFEIKKILEHFDHAYQKADGTLNQNTFRVAMKAIFEQPELDERIVQNAWKATTLNSEADVGHLDLEGFISWYVMNMFTLVAPLKGSSDRAASDALVYQLARKHEVSTLVMDKVKRRFDTWDTNKSGVIEYWEFESMMKEILNAATTDHLCEERMARFWQEIDTNANGIIDFSEFTAWYLKYFNPDDENDLGGPVEAFYASYNPDQQRHNELVNRVKAKDVSALVNTLSGNDRKTET